MAAVRRALVIAPIGKKKLADGTEIDGDAVFDELLAPAVRSAGLAPHRVDPEPRDGSIRQDVSPYLLEADVVLADLTTANRNVWYEIATRHSLRPGDTVIAYGLRGDLPFDISGLRVQRYTLIDGKPDPNSVEAQCKALAEVIRIGQVPSS